MFGGRPIGVMVIVEEEGFVLVPFSFEDDNSWTGVTGGNRFDGKDNGIIGRSERARGPGMAMGGVGARATCQFQWTRELTGCAPIATILRSPSCPPMRLVLYETAQRAC
jgi:hypothetical protein